MKYVIHGYTDTTRKVDYLILNFISYKIELSYYNNI